MLGDMRPSGGSAHCEAEPQTLGSLVAECAAVTGLDLTAPRQPIDHEMVTEAYVTDARRRDAQARFKVFVADNPQLAETDWTREQFDANRDAIAAVMGWQYGKRGVLASGPTGRGKTRAIIELFRRLACEEGRDVRYWFAGDWFAALQAQVYFGRDEARGWVEACAARPLVIIDDLGQEAMQTTRADWAQGWLFRFLDLRIARGLPLIVSTNLSARDMAVRANDVRGDPLVRRFLDLCDIVKFK